MCKNTKVSINCSTLDHGACSKTTKCSNCQLSHKANDKNCEAYKYEQSAVSKANAEHMSIGYAKQQLDQSKSYARALNLLPLTTSRGPVGTPSLAVGVSTPVVEFQVSGLGAKSLKTRTHSTKASKLPVVGNESPSDDEALPSSLPSPTFKVVNLSQAESLPDLMESEQLRNPMRGRAPSGSSPCAPNEFASVHNGYSVLSSSEASTSVEPKNQGKEMAQITAADIHHPPKENQTRRNKDLFPDHLKRKKERLSNLIHNGSTQHSTMEL